MRNASALHAGLIGYLYRWLRNAGLVAFAGGGLLLGVETYHEVHDGRADATVTSLEIACVLVGDSVLTSALAKRVECSEADAVKAHNAQVPLAVREELYVRIAFQSEIGADYHARLSAASLGKPDVQRGETVSILYDRANPLKVRGVPGAARYAHGGGMLAAGFALLMLVSGIRRIAGYRSNVATEIDTMERAYRQAKMSGTSRARYPGKDIRRA